MIKDTVTIAKFIRPVYNFKVGAYNLKKYIMIVQISSGQGPAECELAVVKLFHALQHEFPDIQLLTEHPTHKF